MRIHHLNTGTMCPIGRRFVNGTGGIFFTIGSLKSRWSTASWWSSGLSTLLVGAVAAGLAYGVGVFLEHLVR